MEYSVYDLIRVLLKKWYVIILAMCVIGGLSVFTAQYSYTQAVANYEASIAETVSAGVDTGTLSASYLYDYELIDLTKYLAEAERRMTFYQRFTEELGVSSEEEVLSVSSLAGSAYSAASQEAAALLTDTRVLAETQTAMDAFHYVEPPVLNENEEIVVSEDSLDVSSHFTVEVLPESVVRLTVSGLEEAPARQLLAAYLESLEAVGRSDYSISTTMMERENTYTPAPLRLSQSAEFAQVVMAKPEKTPVMVRTVGTAAAFAFVLSCFLILIVTFVKDSRRSAVNRTV